MSQFDLLRKTELKIEGISLKNANLNQIADVIAEILKTERKGILVTDVQDEILTIDVLEGSLDVRNILAKKDTMLRRLSRVPGVVITRKTSICAEGILSWIALDSDRAKSALKRSIKIAREICQRLSKRAIIFSTGFEVSSGQIQDTNTPTISQRLETEGYSVTIGPTIKDDELLIAANLRQAIDDGFGLIITTGGVGAEGKDRTIEAVLALDPEAATPYICKYEKGVGRHHKDGVRIAVGQVSQTLIVALPGPNDEVKSSLDVLVNGLASNPSKLTLANHIAGGLRKRMRGKIKHQSNGD